MNLNEVNIVGLEDVYRDLKKAVKAHVPGLSGNTALGKNLVLKVLTALDNGECDYKSAIDAIENIFSFGQRAEARAKYKEYQDAQKAEQSDEPENESLKVRDALNILKENGYTVE